MWPIEHTLDKIETLVSSQLVDAAAFVAARRLLGELPEIATDFYFETRIGAEGGNIDLSCRVPANEGRPSQLRRARLLCDFAARLPSWAGVYAFAQRWSEPLPAAEQAWPALWLGFDDVATAALDAPPCVSLELGPQLGSASALASAEAAEPLLQVLELLLDAKLDAAVRNRVVAVLGCLPERARVVYASVMLPRADRPLKVNVELPREDVLGLLDDLGWQGSRGDVQEMLDAFCAMPGDVIRLDLTLSEGGGRRLGIELLSKGLRQGRSDVERILVRLQQRGLCAASKGAALSRWWGSSPERYPGHSFSTSLTRTWYAKWCYVEGERVMTKVYLGFSPRLFPLSLVDEHD